MFAKDFAIYYTPLQGSETYNNIYICFTGK